MPRTQVFEVTSLARTTLYVKQNLDTPRWWGLSMNVFAVLSRSPRNWHFVLLLGNGEEGFSLSHSEVMAMKNGLTHNSHDYIVHPRDIERGFHFFKFSDFFQHLLT
jgi:hypothetical protein